MNNKQDKMILCITRISYQMKLFIIHSSPKLNYNLDYYKDHALWTKKLSKNSTKCCDNINIFIFN